MNTRIITAVTAFMFCCLGGNALASGLKLIEPANSSQDVFQFLTMFIGITPSSFVGQSLAAEGDLNGDSKNDLVIGANGAGSRREGEVYIFYNKSFSQITQLSDADAIIAGDKGGGQFGWALTSRGDLDGDGNKDLVVTALINNGTGRIFVYPGGEGRIKGRMSASDARYVITSTDSTETFGFSLCADGDINGDGIDDLVVGAPSNSDAGLRAGKAYIFLGGGWGKEIRAGDAACVITGETEEDNLGSSFSLRGDLNGDGIDDLAAGAFFCSRDSSNSGRVYVFEGRKLWPQKVSAGDADLTIGGYHSESWLGTAAEIVKDINGDKYDELLIGASGEYVHGDDAGAAYLFYGGKRTGVISARNADLTFVSSRIGNNFGTVITTAGDIDRDGKEDWVISEPGGLIGGERTKGRVYLFPTSLLGRDGLETIIEEPVPENNFGNAVAIGDITGDGRNEIIVGANWDSLNGKHCGKVAVFTVNPIIK